MKPKTVRLTDYDEKMLDELSNKYKMSESELIRYLIRKEYEKLMQFYLED
jgi:Arc/MetJ-type ribon-helix-helix transcriptional regulator